MVDRLRTLPIADNGVQQTGRCGAILGAFTPGTPRFDRVGFSVKLAPGVRVRASSRGLRTSVGPRAARVHFGAGRSGLSTGAGPVGFYTSLGGGSSRRSSGRRTSTGTSTRALAAAEKTQQAQQLAAALTAIIDLHRPDFAPAQRPVAPPPPAPDTDAIIARHRKAALKDVSLFNRSARAAAKAAADKEALAEAAALVEGDQRLHADHQAQLDALWQRLLDNDPDVVLSSLAEAFEDNEAAAAPVGVEASEASLVVLVPRGRALAITALAITVRQLALLLIRSLLGPFSTRSRSPAP
jgi:hypothetical protein